MADNGIDLDSDMWDDLDDNLLLGAADAGR
jgi:hypothetical protein